MGENNGIPTKFSQKEKFGRRFYIINAQVSVAMYVCNTNLENWPKDFSGMVTPGGFLGSGIDSAYSLSWENSFSGSTGGGVGSKKFFLAEKKFLAYFFVNIRMALKENFFEKKFLTPPLLGGVLRKIF